MEANVDVLIVGAGPVGLSLAAKLAAMDQSFRIIDSQVAGANTSRAAVVHARTLEVLEEIGVTEALLSRGIKVPLFRVRDRDDVLMTVDFSDLPTAYPYALMCSQAETEHVILERLEAFGGSVLRTATLIGTAPAGDRVVATIENGGSKFTVAAKFVVGCDGMHSTVRKQACIDFEGGSYAQDFVLGDVQMDWPYDRNEINLFFSDAGLVVVAPLPGGRHRLVATVDAGDQSPSVGYLQELLDRRGPNEVRAKIRELVWGSRFHVHHRVAETNLKGSYVLCGDAAHVHSPAGGQGMNTGIQDAITLARPLAEALKSGDRGALSAWSLSRHEIALDVVALTDRMTRAATIKSPVGRTFRNAALSFLGTVPPIRRAIANNLSELNTR